nr:FAD-binding oxidoreductase [Deltaproteobacteria bacterium]
GTGVRMHPALDLYRTPAPRPWWADAVPGLSRLPASRRPDGFVDGFSFEAPVIDTRAYLPYLQRRFLAAGGRIVERTVIHLDQPLEHAPLVFCCAGLGSKGLASDPSVYPIRGQLVHVDDPGLDHIVLDEHGSDGLAYVVPRGDDCVLGGTAEPHDDDMSLRPADSDGIVERCARLEPRLAHAKRQAEVVGLRPGRDEIRLEAESHPGGWVVHDYGHCGAGVTLSWGCAEEAVRLGLARLAPPTRPLAARGEARHGDASRGRGR